MYIEQQAKIRFLGVALLLIVGMSAGFLGGKLSGIGDVNTVQNIQKGEVVLKSQGQLISSIANDVSASVVSVNVQGTPSVSEDTGVFGMQLPAQTQESAGTGIILTKSGLIMTNRHVVPDGTTSVSITLANGTTYNNVTILGRTAPSDPLDVAFLKINNTNGQQLVPATLGNSSQMEVGDPVIAIGNALGQYQNTVTSGIISGEHRSVQASDSSGEDSENLQDLLQTDASINEGNSGGPLVNLEGQVIGMDTAIAGDAEGIGFAIPMNDLIGTINNVEATGKLSRPYLGTLYVPVTTSIAQQYKLSVNQGAYIPPSNVVGQASIVNGGPADKAGIKEGDVITKVNNSDVTTQNSLSTLIGQYEPGDKIKITLIRGSKQLVISVKLGTAPAG
jgi:serine protease Do